MIQFKCATQSKPIFIGLPALVVIHGELFFEIFRRLHYEKIYKFLISGSSKNKQWLWT